MKNFFKQMMWVIAGVSGVVSFSSAHAIEVQMGNRAQTMGMAFTAVADDPSAVVHNPAGLTQIKGTEIDVGINWQFINLDYTDTTGANHPTDGSRPVPTAFFSTDKLGPFTLGAGLYVPFGSSAEINSEAAFPYMKSELGRMDLTIAAAYKFGDSVSVGLGLTTGYVTVLNKLPLAGGGRFYENLKGFGFTGVGGILWTPHPKFKAGINYRGPMKVDVSGETSVAGIDTEVTAELPFPGTLSFGVAFMPIKELTISADVDWTHWGFFDEVERHYDDTLPNSTQPLNGTSAHDYRIGFEIRPSNDLLDHTSFRLGYSYQEAGWPKSTIIPTQLEYPLHVAAIGVSQEFWKMRIDLGYEFSTAVNRHVTTNINGFNGDYDGTRHIAMLTTAFKF